MERYDGARVYKTQSTDVYERHNAWVREVVPGGKLLEFEPSQGWEPLCGFLGREVPEGREDPRMNDTKEIRMWFLIGAAMGVGMWVAGLGVLGGAWWYGRKWMT